MGKNNPSKKHFIRAFLKTEFLMIIFLWINIIYSLVHLSSPGIFLISGIVGLTIVSILLKFRNDLSVYLLVFLLGFGIINLISFNDSVQVTLMGFINLTNLILFCILIYKKRKILATINEKWFGTKKSEYAEQRTQRIKFFKKRFNNLTKQELENKLSEELVDEARKAILEIISERELR